MKTTGTRGNTRSTCSGAPHGGQGSTQKLLVVTPPNHLDSSDLKLRDYPHTDAMVIETNVAGWTIPKILVDTNSSINILFLSTFNNMKLSINLLQLVDNPLYGFGGKKVNTIGKISLLVTFGD